MRRLQEAGDKEREVREAAAALEAVKAKLSAAKKARDEVRGVRTGTVGLGDGSGVLLAAHCPACHAAILLPPARLAARAPLCAGLLPACKALSAPPSPPARRHTTP